MFTYVPDSKIVLLFKLFSS